MKIQYIKREDIDKTKWNSCVHYANNGNIFGYMWYLDAVAKDWDGLVEGDYESVMPLVWQDIFPRKKALHQPDLIRELGVYSIHVLSPARIRKFLEAIPKAFKKMELHLNEQNTSFQPPDFQITEKTNHQMLLTETYPDLANNYSEDLKSRLEKNQNIGLRPVANLKPEKIADFYKKHSPDKKNLTQNFHAIQRIMYNVLHRGWGFSSAVLDKNEDLLAANFFIYSHKKVMSWLPLESPAGHKVNALAYLMDFFLQSHAGKPLILDFNTQKENPLAVDLGARSNVFYRIKKDGRKWGVF